jgi:hypothetical protein
MFRIAIVSGIALFTVVAANAGQIQIGGANGLTASTVTGAGCSTGGPCTEQGYVPVMFQSAPVSPPVAPAAGTLVDALGDGGSGVTFSKLNDTGNFWDLPTSTVSASLLTVPIGVFGVTDVWTMINDIEATKANDVSVIFNFGTSATVTSDSLTVKLGNADGVSATGQVRNALVCNSGCAESSQVGLTSGNVINGVTVDADNVWSQSFACPPPALGPPTSLNAAVAPCGTAYLDDQGFFFNGVSVGAGLTNLNTYLVSVQVKEIATAGGGAGLSAITIDAGAPTPEPSTVLLFVAGLGVVGLGRLRKRT